MVILVASTEWLFCPLFSRKTGVREEETPEPGREPTKNLTHVWRQHRESNSCHTGGRRVHCAIPALLNK